MRGRQQKVIKIISVVKLTNNLTSTHNLCFEQEYEKYQNYYLKIFNFLVVKFSVHLNRPVFVMITKTRLFKYIENVTSKN